MKKIDACKLRRKGGFTLVELIVVLVLLAVLSAVAVPTYLGYVDDNKAKQCETHRKALASRLEEMSAMGSDIELTDEMINGDENGCPAGGTYTLSGTEDGSAINSKTITCDKHGSTTVMLKNNSQVTAKSSTETEKKVEKEPEKTETPEPPTDPKFSITVNREKAEMEVDEEQTLTALVVEQTDCTPTGSYTWTVPANFQKIEDNGSSIKIKAVSAGTLCNVSCQSSATVANGSSLNASANTQVTVNEKKNLTVSLYPSTLELTLGEDGKESGSLTANVDISGYNSYACAWTVDKREVAQVTQITGDQTKASVTGLAEGTAIVTCTVTADNGAATATDTVMVTVKEAEKETEFSKTIFVESWGGGPKDDFWVNLLEEKYGLSGLPSGGKWKSDSQDVLTDGTWNVHIFDHKLAGEYPIYYETGDRRIEFILKVSYPIDSIEIHENKYGSEKFTMNLEEQRDIYINYGPQGTTEDVYLYWETEDAGVVSIENRSGRLDQTVRKSWNTITANREGVVQVRAIANSRLHPSALRTAVATITVQDPNKLKDISVNDMGMKVNDTRQIQVNCNPSGVNREGISFVYSGYEDCISIDANGNIKAEKKGSTTVTVQAKKNGEDLEGISCTFNVAVTDLQSISVEPQNVNLKSGETTMAKIIYTPEEADISQVNFVPEGFDPNNFVISQNEKGKLEIQGKQACNNVGVYVKARVYGDEVATSNFQVSVTSDSNSTTEPTAIELVLRNGLPDVMQGKKITVTKYPDETGDIVVCPVPRTASLDAYTVSSCPGDYNLIGNDGVANTYNTGKVTFYVDAKRYNPYVCLQSQVDLSIVENPKILRGIQVSPPQIEMNIEDAIDIVIATPDDTSEENDAAISISPVPTTAEIPIGKIQYWSENSGIASVSNDGIIAAHSTGVTNIKMKVVNENNQMIGSEQSVTVVVKPTTVSFNDKVIPLASWDELRDYIISRKHGGAVSPLPQTNIYAAAYNQYGGAESGYYIIRPGVELTWDDSYSNDMTFDQYLNQGNREKFVRLEKDKIANAWEQVQWLYEGLIVFRNGSYYVYIGGAKSPNTLWTEAQMCENGFVKIA